MIRQLGPMIQQIQQPCRRCNRKGEIKDEKSSPMPENLLDELTLKEIADLFAYLRSTPEQRVADKPDDSTRE